MEIWIKLYGVRKIKRTLIMVFRVITEVCIMRTHPKRIDFEYMANDFWKNCSYKEKQKRLLPLLKHD